MTPRRVQTVGYLVWHWNAALETGGFVVGNEVKVSLSIQAA